MASCLPITSFSFGFRSNRGDWTLRLLKLALPHRNVEVGEVEKTNAPMSPERAAALASGRKEGRSGNLRARAVKFKCASRPYFHWKNKSVVSMLLKSIETTLFKRVETILLKSTVAVRPVLMLKCILCFSKA